MSKCDLLPRVKLAKRCAATPASRLQPLHQAAALHPASRYTVLTRELSELQLRRWWRPLHMISSRTSAGVTGAS